MNSVSIYEIKRQVFASKQFRIMRLCLLFLLCGILQGMASNTYSQTTTLSMKLSDVTIEEVLNQIEEQSDFRFLYNKKMVNVANKVNVAVKKKNITEILDNIFAGEDVTYTISNRQIVLSRKNDIATVAQQAKKITGVVKDKSGEVIIGANIVVKGTQNGVITDLDGNYSIEVPSGNAVLVVSYIGFKPQEVALANRTIVNVELASSVEELDEIVVTAMGIKREKKALGYAMQEVKADALTENRSESVANLLQGKVAGVQISQSGTGMGGSTRIVMRGLSSLSGNNQPLWVVDGIPVNDDQKEAAGEWGGTDYEGAASEINPEDIESISVLKGPNAAALYGSRAQNGAIVVVTKKGKAGQPLTVEYNGNINLSKAYDGYEYQDVYGQGSQGVFNMDSRNSWGPKMEGQTIPHWRSEIYGDNSYSSYAMTPQKDRVSEFYRTGTNLANTLSVTGGGETVSGRLSYTDSRNEGITPTHSLTRQYFDANMNLTNKWLTVGVKANYLRQKGINRPGQGEYGLMNQFVRMPRNIRLIDLKNPVGLDGNCVNWSGNSNEYMNPYSVNYTGNGNRDYRNRLIGQVNASIKFTDYLSLNGKIGIDWFHDQSRSFQAFRISSATGSQYYTSEGTTQEINADMMLAFNKTFGDFNVTSNLGVAKMNLQYRSLSASSGDFTVPGFIALSNGNNQTVGEGRSEKEIHSALGNAQIGYKSMLYLDITGRNDWSSTLPSSNWSYFYPSVSLSGIISEMVKLPEQISYLKARASWAKVGNDTYAYRLDNTYWMSKVLLDILAAGSSSNYPFANLKPEETTSWETGLDMRMFDGRLGLDFTYYNSQTTNQILSIGLAASSGYTSKNINAGKMKSSGFEVMLTGTPIKTKNLQWDVNLNWGTNNTKCAALDPTVKRFTIGSIRMGDVVVDEGGKYGDIISKAFKRNNDGKILIDDNGFPMVETDKKIGNMMPDWTGSIGTTLRWKDIVFSGLIDIKQGGDIISITDNYASQSGNSKRSLIGRDGFVVDGIVESTGVQNAKPVTAQQYYETIAGPTGVGEAFMYDASYAKLRELSLGYMIPAKWLKSTTIKSIKLSLVGRDLLFIYKNTPGTNPEGSFSRSDYAQAFELSSMPPTRNFGFNINVKF